MNAAIQIRRFTAQYHLKAAQFPEKPRLDRLLPEVAGDALELALERAGIGENEILCVRSLHVPVRLRLSRADSTLTAEWAQLLAEAVVNTSVRYASRTQALFEMGAHIAEGRFHRAWAWEQIGLWQGQPKAVDRGGAAKQFASALAREPEAAVAILAALATQGKLQTLTPYLANAWTEIASAVLFRSGLRLDTSSWVPQTRGVQDEGELMLEAVRDGSLKERSARPELPRSLLSTEASRQQELLSLRRARRAAEHSLILRESGSLTLRQSPVVALSILALLEVDPSLVRAGGDGLFDAARSLNALLMGSRQGMPLSPALGPVVPDEAERLLKDAARPSAIGDVSRASDLPSRVPPLVPTSRSQDTPLSMRFEGRTDFGGLFYLLGVVDALHIPERSLACTAIAVRGLSWFLHRLALSLQPVHPDDPAALGFSGLAPTAQNPSLGCPLPTLEEQGWIDLFAAEIGNALRDLLPHPPRITAKLMQFVCRRTARVVAEPGWIDVRFSLTDVSTEIRRAGLDIDLNYVPWLGIVVRFTYE